MTKATPYETAVLNGHVTPFIMGALNPLTPAIDLYRLTSKQREKEKQQAAAVELAPPPAKQEDSPARALAIGECCAPGC
jgi:hypothetical protein